MGSTKQNYPKKKKNVVYPCLGAYPAFDLNVTFLLHYISFVEAKLTKNKTAS